MAGRLAQACDIVPSDAVQTPDTLLRRFPALSLIQLLEPPQCLIQLGERVEIDPHPESVLQRQVVHASAALGRLPRAGAVDDHVPHDV